MNLVSAVVLFLQEFDRGSSVVLPRVQGFRNGGSDVGCFFQMLRKGRHFFSAKIRQLISSLDKSGQLF